MIIKKRSLLRLSALTLTVSMSLMQPFVVVAQTMPQAPTAPTPPPPPPSDQAPVAPTAPPQPTAPTSPVLDPTPAPSEPTPTSEPTQEPTNPVPTVTNSSEPNPTSEATTEPVQSQAVITPTPTPSNSGGGNVGDTEIETGDATATGSITTTGNNNTSITPTGNGSSVSVGNTGNGTGSNNNGSVNLVTNDTSIQNNTADIDNNLALDTTTGTNVSNNNVGNTTIDTGDANTSGTIITAVNTNVDGVAVAEFNIADDHVGDIILDFGANCIFNCGGSTTVANTGNGSDSDNTGTVNTTNNEATFQNNDANIENNMNLLADSGHNDASRNTNGDSVITTGDANVSANVLTMANNNVSGDVMYAVVNIFGNLVGDIIFPEELLGTTACSTCGGSTSVANTGNESESTNTGSVNTTNTDTTVQSNTATITNNLNLDAQTGGNDLSRNTGGTSEVESGNTNLTAQVLNVANMNIVGDTWLVLVNQAGKWIGKIMGAEPGANYAGSEGLEFEVDEYGQITVTNGGNGSGSTNTGSVTQNNNSTLVQTNNANVVNNVNLGANTGGNSTTNNTGGNNYISTGDANIMANIVNFVNNNIAGNGRLFVTVVNVFGSWMGNFVTPGAMQEETNSQPLAENTPQQTASTDSGIGGYSRSDEGDNELIEEDPEVVSVLTSAKKVKAGSGTTLSYSGWSDDEEAVMGIAAEGNPPNEGGSIDQVGNLFAAAETMAQSEAAKKVMNINLAWLVLLAPPMALGFWVKRRLAPTTAV